MTKVIVKRNKWLRGEGATRSALLRTDDNKMCCLGFACLAIGLTENEIAGMKTPIDLTERGLRSKVTQFLPEDHDVMSIHHPAVSKAMMVNDSSNIEGEEREAKLTELLAQVDLQLEFVDE